MSILTNEARTRLAKAFITQSNLAVCIGKPTTWESTHEGYSDLIPPPEFSTVTDVLEPIAYKTLDTLVYAKLDPAGTVNYRGSLYSTTDDYAFAVANGYTSVYLRADLRQDQLPVSIAYRVIGLYADVDGVFNSLGVSYPSGDDATYFVSNPGKLLLLDYRRPVIRAVDQTEVFELILTF